MISSPKLRMSSAARLATAPRRCSAKSVARRKIRSRGSSWSGGAASESSLGLGMWSRTRPERRVCPAASDEGAEGGPREAAWPSSGVVTAGGAGGGACASGVSDADGPLMTLRSA